MPRDIPLAHEIATKIRDAGYSDEGGLRVLAIALGIYAESIEGGHRELKPLTDAMIKAGQIVFDALRDARNRKPGRA